MRPAPVSLPAVVDAMVVMCLYHHPLDNERITYPIPRVAPDPAANQN